ncbi:MAG: hypothetical protein U9N83_07840 [Thermodesulfobacteriota bacterium]|nr:hypothetical protein [Thermodesulfobacteriota bacterium]
MIRKLVPMLIIALFVISITGVAVSEAQEIITGTIIAIDDNTGRISVQDESGKTYTLTAGSDVDLKTFSSGDKVNIEYGGDGVIKSITKVE